MDAESLAPAEATQSSPSLRAGGQVGPQLCYVHIPQLGEDAPDGPHVRRCAVVVTAQKDLRRAIPKSHHLVGVLPEGHREHLRAGSRFDEKDTGIMEEEGREEKGC